jgi:hypothetical protein
MSKADGSWSPDTDKLYSEICAKIRATDEISFKLLGFVPLLSGSGIFLLLFKGGELKPLPLVMLCVAGATITAGLFLWERRNIKTCLLFRDAAAMLEEQFPRGWVKPYTQLSKPSKKYRTWFRKTEAEIVIYTASMLVWLIPIVNILT